MKETFFAVICHENDNVRKNILAEFKDKLHVTAVISTEVTSETLKTIFNVPSKEEKKCLLVYIEDRAESVIDVFGKKNIPVWNLPTNTMQYRYSNGKSDFLTQFMYWSSQEIKEEIRKFFIKKKLENSIITNSYAA